MTFLRFGYPHSEILRAHSHVQSRSVLSEMLLSIPRPTKRNYGGLLNLANNELQDPRLDAIIADFYAAKDSMGKSVCVLA